jgi:SAM-dependent methyltransferase
MLMIDDKARKRMKCEICSSALKSDVLPQTFRCPSCELYKSTFPILINEVQRIDEAARAQALRAIRTANFKQILDQCEDLLPAGATILDVGCAHGWFLKAATARGYKATGIEPDRDMAAQARASGCNVVFGFFPDALPSGERFDFITFNDVFEHLPNVERMTRAVYERLKTGGHVLINLPVSNGVVFRYARLAAKIGVTGPLRRMWQEGLPSPHLSYFSAENLPKLMSKTGFVLVRHHSLESIMVDGLYERIRYDKKVSTATAIAMYGLAHLMRLFGRIAQSDVQYFVFRKGEANG